MLHDFGVNISINNTYKVLDQSSIPNSSEKMSERLKFKFIDVIIAGHIKHVKYGRLSNPPLGIVS